ncbi:MAG: phytanoyl-CoA dioxygenase family protein [Burkholderiaceae bacterium]
MTTVFQDRAITDDERRGRLYDGDLFVYSPLAASLKLVELARSMIEDAFGGKDPETAQFHYPVEEYAAILSRLKPAFIHHPECKKLLPEILVSLGCDPEAVHFDVPRMRSSTSHGYLTTGIAYAFHPHRDTWYSAPMCQINWWLPIYELDAANGLVFYPRYHREPVRNDSHVYDYQNWNKTSRFSAGQHIGKDTRKQPHPRQSLDLTNEIVVVPPVGGLIVFSAAQLHGSIANRSGRTRFSIDFRTVHAGDAEALRGARNIDSFCTGSAMYDYLRCADLAHLSDSILAQYEAGPPLKPADPSYSAREPEAAAGDGEAVAIA